MRGEGDMGRNAKAASKQRASTRSVVINVIKYVFLSISAILMLMPLVWLVATAFKDQAEVFANPFALFTKNIRLENFSEAWSYAPFSQYYLNTIVISVGILAVQLVTISLAGYAFARLKFPNKDALFVIYLTQLMITPQSTILPNYMTISSMHLLDTKLGVMLPYFASALGTFMMRQAFMTLPKDLEDAALIDGCTRLQTFRLVALPLVKPTLIAFSIMSVSFHWNEFFWPMIVTESQKSRPLTVGLAIFAQQAEGGAQWSLLMAATLIVILPLILVFLIFQRQFIESFMSSGLKG